MQDKNLTSIAGAPVADNQNIMTVGPRGPLLMQDLWFLEKMSHFDREVIPERRMHARGSGAYGRFTVTRDISRYTKAEMFKTLGKVTPVFMRFSVAAKQRGEADALRDVRGFAIKFYTDQGNWDLAGNNTPVFFVRDPLKFPDLNHVLQRNPQTNLHDPQNKWDFWTMLPESLHQVTITMSDRGLPCSYRHMDGFGSHTFSMYNSENQRVWVKFHFKTQQGIKNYTDQEAAVVRGRDPDSHQRDLYNSIVQCDYPKWTMYIQVMTEVQAENHCENPFDITKVWHHKEYPLIEVGQLELNTNPKNYFAEVEQAAFNPGSIVPGIGLSPDKLLQGRLFSYADAQRYRLGVNHYNIPVNMPKCGYNAFHRDGAMRVDGDYGNRISYQPSCGSYEWQDQPRFAEPPQVVKGKAARYDPYLDPTDNVYYQAGDLYRLMTDDKRRLLIENTAADIAPVKQGVKYRHAANCYLADCRYGQELAAALGLDIKRVIELAQMDLDKRCCATR